MSRDKCVKVLVILLVLLVLGQSAVHAQDGNAIVPAGARLEKIFDGGVVLTEGVAVAPDGMVYFSDITFSHVSKDKKGVIEAGHIWEFNPNTGKTRIFRSPSGMSNGIKFDAAGNMIVAEGADYGGRRVIRTDMKTGKSYIIAAHLEGRPFNSPNDITTTRKAASISATRATSATTWHNSSKAFHRSACAVGLFFARWITAQDARLAPGR
jgi:sugar lactone lactonase YvrE